MAKNKNKGFSLIEIVIAIAILTLLLTPILKQLAQTMSVNRKTKEQQYANENAEYILQYAQTNSQKVLADGNTANEIYRVNDESTIEAKRKCQLYYIDATGAIQPVMAKASDGSMINAEIEYTTYTYVLNDVELGSRNTAYSRMVVLDDLSVKVSAFTDYDGKAYRVSYNNSTTPTGFQVNNEGCLVQYSSIDGEDVNGDGINDKYVSAIICKQYGGDASTNPNELNIGNVHSLDVDQMALINGYATEFDDQARNDLYSEIMELYKNSPYEEDNSRWEQEINGQHYIAESKYTENIRKLTILNILDDVTNSKYIVSVDVSYEGNLVTQGGVSKLVQKNYTVWTKEFPYTVEKNSSGAIVYKDPCPEVYIEYQPFATIVNSDYKDITYASDEYIIINNQVNDAKIYLCKPLWDQAISAFFNVSTDAAAVETLLNTNSYYTNNRYDTDANHLTNTTKVKLNIASANPVDGADDNKFTIYTNLDLSGDKTSVNPNPQFVFSGTSEYNDKFKIDGSTRVVSQLNMNYIKNIGEEESTDNRLYTVTVTLSPITENVNAVSLTGAKGAN